MPHVEIKYSNNLKLDMVNLFHSIEKVINKSAQSKSIYSGFNQKNRKNNKSTSSLNIEYSSSYYTNNTHIIKENTLEVL